MTPRQIVLITVTVAVLAWSTVMVAAGQTAAIAALAPSLALTVQQIVHTARTRTTSTTSAGNRLDAAADEEDDAP